MQNETTPFEINFLYIVFNNLITSSFFYYFPVDITLFEYSESFFDVYITFFMIYF